MMKAARRQHDDASNQETAAKKRKTGDGEEQDQVATALRKIGCSIGVPSKFNKAARLVLNLCHEGHITASYSDLFFEVVSYSMLDKEVCLMAEYRKGYCKLVSAAVAMASMFGSSQRKQLEVYQIWSICRSELETDDSFVFGKNMSKLKELALQLPPCGASDEDVYASWKDKMNRMLEHYRKHRRSMDVSVETQTEHVTHLWTEEECLAARREAIIDWMEAAKAVYKHQWACTAIDMSISVLNENKERFCKAQRERIEALLRFSKEQKMRRKMGPSTKEKKRDTTTFEEARSEWSKAEISTRGTVGDSGDHKTEAWLG